MPYEVKRDFIGYGPNPPDPHWPGGARLAVNFVFNYEEGSEPSFAHGDGYTETGLTESNGQNQVKSGRDLVAEGMFEYGSRVGFWRLHRLFQERGLPLTVFGCAIALEANPQAAAPVRAAGYDICPHGWRWVHHFELSEAEEREHTARAVTSIERSIGHKPEGWYCRYGPSVNTRRLVVEHGGFLYDSDSYADELPYYLQVGEKPHLVVPYTLSTNDVKFHRGNIGTAPDFEQFLRDALDVLRTEGAQRPKMMSVGMHARLLGHPGRAAGLARFLDHVKSLPDVWVCRRVDIARHWLATHPPEGR